LSRRLINPTSLIISIAAVAMVAGSVALSVMAPDFRWDNLHVHAAVEGISAFAALILAALVLLMQSRGNLPANYSWVACGLVAMFVFDGVHSLLPLGESFVWTHTMATFVGGVLFAGVWMPDNFSRQPFCNKIPCLVFILSLVAALTVIIFPASWPDMIRDGDFTETAHALNIIGGAGFLLAAFKPMTSANERLCTGNTVFIVYTVLFATAGVTFVLSSPWDAPWWLWHGLRLLAQFIAVFYFFWLMVQMGKQTETAQIQLRDAINTISEGFVLYDHDGNLVICNQKFKDFYGYSDEEAHIGVHRKKLGEIDLRKNLIRLDDNPDIKYIGRRDGLTPGSTFTMTLDLNDGRTLELKDYITESGELVSIQTDITDKKKAEDAALLAKVDAEKASRAKSEFLAAMSHELRTPLNAVLGFAQMLQIDKRAPLRPGQKQNVDCIVEGGQHLLELVNEILDLAKVEANQLDFNFEDVVVNDVISECAAMATPLGEPRHIKIINEFADADPVMLRCDRMRLKQILINLLSNAIKFNKDNGTVTIGKQGTDDYFVRISVVDTGLGIAEKDYADVFKMFHRLHSDAMIAREGTGIGLTVTKLLVERMSGRTGFKSQLGKGSTFWIEFPRN